VLFKSIMLLPRQLPLLSQWMLHLLGVIWKMTIIIILKQIVFYNANKNVK